MKTEAALLAAILGVWGLSISAQAAPWAGAGDPNDPYLIYNANDMHEIGLHAEDWDAHFRMAEDIDLSTYPANIFNLIGNGPMTSPGSLAIDEENEKVYFVDSKDICCVNFDGKDYKKLITNLSQPRDLVIDLQEGKIYWNDSADDIIQRANLDGTAIETCILDTDIQTMAFDPVINKIYWSDNYTMKRSDPNGGNVEFVVYDNDDVRCISLDAVNEKVYWSNGFPHYHIKRANLDGSSVESMYVGAKGLNDISLDLINNKMYWVQTYPTITGSIRRANLDGTDIEDVVTEGLNSSTSIKVIGGSTIYWSDHTNKYIKRFRLDGSLKDYILANFFSGVFDGNGYTIANLAYSANGLDRVGLFSTVSDPNAIIKNVTIVDPNIISQGENALVCSPLVGVLYSGSILNCRIEGGQIRGVLSVAGIAGQSSGLISDCNSTCSIYGKSQVGGLAGYNLKGTILNSSFSGNVEATEYFVGGLSGINREGIIDNCFFSGTVTSNSGDTGGLVGYNPDGLIMNSYATGVVSAFGYVGGLVGYNNTGGQIYGSYAVCDVYGTGAHVGGLVGNSHYGRVENCFSDSNVFGGSDVGGLAGEIYHTRVTNCYANGSVSGDNNIGGLLGESLSGILTNCYSNCYVTGSGITGGLVGSGGRDWDTKHCFWDIDSSDQTDSSVGAGKSTLEMKQFDTFVAWTCDGSWAIDDENDYPRLSWEQKEGIPIVPFSYWGHTGYPNDPIQISTAKQLQNLRLMSCMLDKHFTLLNDIDLLGQEVYMGEQTGFPFRGVFNGNNHSISNLNNSSLSLFAKVDDPNAVIRDIILINPTVGPGGTVGCLIGELTNGIVENCHVENGYLEGSGYVGGLVGYSYQSLIDCSFSGQVIGEGNAGGLVGNMERERIENCHTTGTVSGSGYTGGIVGYCYGGDIIECSSSCDVTSNASAGGIAGFTGGYYPSAVRNCIATGNVDGGSETGGLIGYFSNGEVTNSTASGMVTGWAYVGGFTGRNHGQISGCISEGDVTGQADYVGGFAGENTESITNCFSRGKVGGRGRVGGFAGLNWHAEIIDCYAGGNVVGSDIMAGGLIGYHLESDVYDSFTTGSVTGTDRVGGLIGQIRNNHGNTNVFGCHAVGNVEGDSDIGGLVGLASMGYEGNIYISKCSSLGQVNASTNAGGLVGRASGRYEVVISECYSKGDVYITSDRGGGLIGDSAAMVINCYSHGNVTGSGTSNYIGGLMGYHDIGPTSNCYATGNTIGNSYIGGIAGYSYHSYSLPKCFWDIEVGGPDNGMGTPKTTLEMRTKSTFTVAGWDFVGETANGTDDIWKISEGADYPRLAWENLLIVEAVIDNAWMYQNVLASTNSELTAEVSIIDDPLYNSGYTYEWEIILPDDVTIAPTITGGGGSSDPCCTFAAPSCNEAGGISDSGQPLTVKVTVTGADFGNTGIAEAEFGIALLGDANNDGVVNVADRSIINAFWRLGAAGPFTFTDCNVNGDTAVNVADRSIANAVWRGVLGQNSVSAPCPLR